MRSLQLVVLGSLVVFATLAGAQKETETQQDGFSGRVKSVATMVEMAPVEWQQPAGPTLLFPIFCRDCEYSADGYRTRSGQVTEGQFYGEMITLMRDGNGHVTQAVFTDAPNGQLFRRTMLGPFGRTEDTFYLYGKESGKNIVTYDASGRVTETLSLDPAGAQIDRTLTKWTKDDWTERIEWSKEQVRRRETYDPASDEQHFTGFDESGNVTVNWTYAHGQVRSFWEPSNSPGEIGSSFVNSDDKANPIHYQCHNSGACDPTKVHYDYADAAKQNPASAEWRDASGNLVYGAYYAYDFDAHGNWTHREVSVWSAKLGARKMYETDDRLITYWE